jgi:hypothetical protein
VSIRGSNRLVSCISVSNYRVLPSNEEVKAIVAIGGLALVLAVLCLLATALRLPPSGSWPPAETPWPGNPESDVAAVPLARTNLLMPLLASGGPPQVEVPSIPQPARPQRRASPGQLPAGVYKTWPYTCIVVVPGPCPDDRAIVKPSGKNYRMPIIKPDLQFIPWGLAK